MSHYVLVDTFFLKPQYEAEQWAEEFLASSEFGRPPWTPLPFLL